MYKHGDESVDLDATQKDQTWGREAGTGDGVVEGFSYGSSSVGLYGNGEPETKWLYEDGGAQLTYSACKTALALQSSDPDQTLGSLDEGSGFCLRTSAGRIATLVLKHEANAEKLDFDVKVWEKH